METTLNVRYDILRKISDVAETNKISSSDMALVLIKKVLVDIPREVQLWKLVQYQKRCPRDQWLTLHVNVREDDYEYFLDLRKLLKMSVSLILAFAVEKFLIDVKIPIKTDNNRFRNYIIVYEDVDSVMMWTLVWGFPPNIHNHIKIPFAQKE